MAFRENLLHLRAANNMTQEQLAVLVGVSRQSVAKWEAGKAYPEMDKLIKLSQIFHCSIDELVQGDLTDREAEPTMTVTDTAQDLFGYDEFMRQFARRISNGVMYIILGVAFGTICFSIADEGVLFDVTSYVENILTAAGVILILAGVAAGLTNIIPAGLEHSAFVFEHPYLEDFYTPSQKQAARRTFSNQLVGGIICIFVGICWTIVFSMTAQTEILTAFGMLLFVAVGVRFIISGSMTLARVNISAYNLAAQERGVGEREGGAFVAGAAFPHRNKNDNLIGAFCGTIMIIATIAGLVMLFVPEFRNDLFWLVWPIGGLLCGIVSLLLKAFGTAE